MKGRQFSKKIGNLRSQYLAEKSGLPQRTVLSPILLIFFVSDMFKYFNCKNFVFAEDRNLQEEADTETQVYLNCQIIFKHLKQWYKNWRFAVIVRRCQVSTSTLRTRMPRSFLERPAKVPKTQKPWV